MSKKRKTHQKKIAEYEGPFFRVFLREDNRPVYLGKGTTEAEANALSEALASPTYVKEVG